jgi:putative FmdB family regulatory protein
MPNYEYRCQDCHQRFEIFLSYQDYGKKQPTCLHCGSVRVLRKISRIRMLRSDEARLENLADPESLANIDQDPRALGKMMRQMSHEVGEDMAPEFNEVVGRLEAGQNPEEIEKELPDLGAGDDGSDFSGGMDDF